MECFFGYPVILIEFGWIIYGWTVLGNLHEDECYIGYDPAVDDVDPQTVRAFVLALLILGIVIMAFYCCWTCIRCLVYYVAKSGSAYEIKESHKFIIETMNKTSLMRNPQTRML